MKTLPLIFAVITALLPFILQKTGLSVKYGFKMKMLCAFMYIVTGVLSAFAVNTLTAYSVMILSALLLGFLGDFFLDCKGKKLFPLGAAFFAAGHIIYSCAFLFPGEYKAVSFTGILIGVTIALTAVIVILAKTKLKLTGKKNMILIYVPVLVFAFLCALTSGASAVKAGNLSYGLCLIAGGVLFLSSDIMIGVGKGGIKRPEFLHNAVSYTYFAAQALFSLSIYFQ